jgi:hypothetical protein
VLAPVAPANVSDLAPAGGTVSLGSVKNQTTTSKDGKKLNSLLLTGTGAPNTDIFIYVFSDPLVLRAQTDEQGKWEYVLETPLKAGNHEVYAVAEKDAGSFVRTSAVPITIAAAAPGGSDGSLILERQWSAAQIGFAAGAVVMILAALGVFFTILRRRRHSATAPAPATAATVAPVVAPAPVTPAPAPAPPAPSTPVPPQQNVSPPPHDPQT